MALIESIRRCTGEAREPPRRGLNQRYRSPRTGWRWFARGWLEHELLPHRYARSHEICPLRSIAVIAVQKLPSSYRSLWPIARFRSKAPPALRSEAPPVNWLCSMIAEGERKAMPGPHRHCLWRRRLTYGGLVFLTVCPGALARDSAAFVNDAEQYIAAGNLRACLLYTSPSPRD